MSRWLSRTAVVGFLFAGCTSAGLLTFGAPASTPSPAPVAAEPPPPAHPSGRAELAAWARQAHDTGVDCPMSPEDAQHLMKTSNGAEGMMASAIGCMCSVELTCGGYQRENCPLVEPSKNLVVHHLGMADRDSEDDRLIAAWEDKLYAGRKAPLAKVTRATPLPPPDRSAYLATVDQQRYIAQIEDDHHKINEMVSEKLWGSLDIYQTNAHSVLADLEKRTCGAHNDEARAIVAKVDAVFAAHRKERAASERLDRKINSDGQFRQLEAERDRLEKQLAELEHAHGKANDVCTESARSGWQICRVAARIEEVNHQINHRIDVLSGS